MKVIVIIMQSALFAYIGTIGELEGAEFLMLAAANGALVGFLAAI